VVVVVVVAVVVEVIVHWLVLVALLLVDGGGVGDGVVAIDVVVEAWVWSSLSPPVGVCSWSMWLCPPRSQRQAANCSEHFLGKEESAARKGCQCVGSS